MTKEAIVKQYAEATNQPYNTANTQVAAMLQVITKNIVGGNIISLYGFGKFEPVQRKSCSRKSVKFTASVTIKEALNEQI